MNKKKIDIQKLLEQGETLQIRPKGYSMYPMLVPNRDAVIIKRAELETLKRGDVVLYQRNEGILVLHRIWNICQEGVFLVGDNQVTIEGPLRKEQIKGILIAFIRNGKTITVKNPCYILYSTVWLKLRPMRFGISRSGRKFLRLFIKDRIG